MSRRGAALVLILVLGMSACSTASTTSPVAASSRTQPAQSDAVTRTTTPTPTSALATASSGVVTKVLVFIVENHSLSQMKSQMPYTFGLAQRFGYATNYTAIRHPSLPNYVAIAGGQTYGITNDDNPSANPIRGTSVFGQAVASGKTAAVFVDGMPENCAPNNGGSDYAVKHNPWAYFINERGDCQKHDVPVDQLDAAITGGTLPNAALPLDVQDVNCLVILG